MKVSIIVAAYNIENYIERCLLSIVNQTLKDIEVIVVNDGSTDNTLEKIKIIQEKYTSIKLLDQKNQGAIEARKSGLQVAKGEYILFVDGDDWLELNALELLYNNAISNKSDIVIYNAFLSYDNRKEKFNIISNSNLDRDDYVKNLFLGKIAPSLWSKFVKLEFLKCNSIKFPNDISFAEDLASVASWFMHNPKISILRENLYNYYQRDDSITKKKSMKVLEVNKAFSFIENELIKMNLYNKYKESFEYMVYIHLFETWFLKEYLNEKELAIKIYKDYKNRKININDNCIISKKINTYPISLRVRVKSYNKSYIYGRIYDNTRRLVKGS